MEVSVVKLVSAARGQSSIFKAAYSGPRLFLRVLLHLKWRHQKAIHTLKGPVPLDYFGISNNQKHTKKTVITVTGLPSLPWAPKAAERILENFVGPYKINAILGPYQGTPLGVPPRGVQPWNLRKFDEVVDFFLQLMMSQLLPNSPLERTP